jgi:hypothetical protein
MYIILQKDGKFRWLGVSIIIIVACLEIQLHNAHLYGVEVECLCNEYHQRLIQAEQGFERTGG